MDKTNNNTTIQEILSEIKEGLKMCIYINSRTFQRRKEQNGRNKKRNQKLLNIPCFVEI